MDKIQPEDQRWRDYIASQKTTAAVLGELGQLCEPGIGDSPEQQAALGRVHRLLEALALRA